MAGRPAGGPSQHDKKSREELTANKAVAALFEAPAPTIKAEQLPDLDWVVESQKGVDPSRAGRAPLVLGLIGLAMLAMDALRCPPGETPVSG